ncbi:microtubule-associated protein RP/EB family member 1 [Terfezia boudieri ATCC MYA-4762]|uniref:Microtubule-associated protein RP/EB family member 1 n=1 Tax=Terfezia boudieri ATCC MYA-4762 TaxID=1051890 RepID=A0A3N4LLS6_9PEZI|nr:microtubule-associated protein RP/EB family member 1 [Terfezia boudieri ATCC MYA-4762]
MGESRQELLNWLNNLLQLNITRVEQLGTGAALTQVFDSIYGDLPMHKVKFNVNTEYAYLNNFKVLQNVFTQRGIDRPLPVERLVKCKFQDNLEFLQWTKRYWDQFYPGGEYDAVGRRKGQGVATGGGPAPRAPSTAVKRGTTPTVGAATRTRTPLGGGVGAASNNAALQNEINMLKESVVGLERERDFYFSKLRDIELLVQQAIELEPTVQGDPDGLVAKIQNIMYSTEEGFEIPETGPEEETF